MLLQLTVLAAVGFVMAHQGDKTSTGVGLDWKERVFVQADFEGEPKRAAVWGADAACTAAAVEVFRDQGFLAELLERIWRFRLGVVV